MWQSTQPLDLTRSSFQLLLQNRVPLIRVPGFAAPRELSALKDALLGWGQRSSSVRQVVRFGVSQYQDGLQLSKENYFRVAARAERDQRRIFAQSFDPVARFLGLLNARIGRAGVMREPGYGRYFAGNGKLRNGESPLHVDYAGQDSMGWAVYRAEYQLAWNLYADQPEHGGELLLWDRQWQPGDDRFLVGDSYRFDDRVVAGAPRLDVKPRAGEVLLINSRNYHAVATSRDRFAFGSFVSVFPGMSCRLWS